MVIRKADYCRQIPEEDICYMYAPGKHDCEICTDIIPVQYVTN